jgi:hypothetical protein
MPVIGPPPAGTSVSLRIVGGTTSELDLTQYMMLQEGDGFDPASGTFLEPEFNDSSTGAGQGLVNIDVGNKEFTFPLHLKSATKDGLHALVRSLRRKLDEPDVLVEWRDYGATDVTYYDIEFGRWDPGYAFFKAKHNWIKGSLRCWVRPYGHTATERIAGTAAGSGFMQIVSADTISGDVGAEIICDITGGGDIRHLYGLSVVPSGVAVQWPAASVTQFGSTSVLTGASGAVASQYRAIHATFTSQGGVGIFYLPQGRLEGRQRLLAVARTANLHGAYLSALPVGGLEADSIGPLAFLGATHSSGDFGASAWRGWQLVDLGVLPMPVASMRSATQAIVLSGVLASQALGSMMASPALHISAVYALPDERTTIIVDRGVEKVATSNARLDGTLRESFDPTLLRPLTGYQRGGFQTINPGEQAIAFSLGRVASDTQAVTLRVRERFTFAR